MKLHNDPPAEGACGPTSLERLARRLIQHSARRSPAALAERLEEEWLADLAAQRDLLSRLRFAIGCWWATKVIAHDYLASGAAAANAAPGGTVTLGQYDLSFFSRRTTVLLLIVALHAIVIYGFATGFAQRVIQGIPRPMTTSIVNRPELRELPPPMIQSGLVAPRVPISPIAPTFNLSTDIVTDSPTRPTPPAAPPAKPPVAPHVVTRILGGPGQGFPDTDDFYPLTSRRLGETGAATVRVCVDPRGRLASSPIIARSSGNTRLDAAALMLARAGSGHYRSTTEDGVAVTSCLPFRIRFELKE